MCGTFLLYDHGLLHTMVISLYYAVGPKKTSSMVGGMLAFPTTHAPHHSPRIIHEIVIYMDNPIFYDNGHVKYVGMRCKMCFEWKSWGRRCYPALQTLRTTHVPNWKSKLVRRNSINAVNVLIWSVSERIHYAIVRVLTNWMNATTVIKNVPLPLHVWRTVWILL